MRVLIVGKGGREHAIAWKISKSPLLDKLFCINPNPGMQSLCSPSNAEDIPKFCKENGINLVIIGPENPIAEGLANRLLDSDIKVFAPTAEAAKLEASKVFAKRLMERHNIPTANFEVFEDSQKAKRFVKDFGAPIVIKADGLASGKGVFVCQDINQALEAINLLMSKD
ncbi:MAG: ATP-grasp domain-containing protein, partial [Aquificaceae bacterium]|nr:ATP-grasp domain-containing protein [Aquificaceae bacterium]MDW8237688.1 ATP-grasp domain-containing protein [Aquificaceae bacterium]